MSDMTYVLSGSQPVVIDGTGTGTDNTIELDGPDAADHITFVTNSDGSLTLTGNDPTGFDSTATITDIQNIDLDGTTYALTQLPNPPVEPANYNGYIVGTLYAISTSGGVINLSDAPTTVFLIGAEEKVYGLNSNVPEVRFTDWYDGEGGLEVGNTIFVGGPAAVSTGNGQFFGLNDSAYPVDFTYTGNFIPTEVLTNTTAGSGGAQRVALMGGTSTTPDEEWTVREDDGGAVTLDGTASGYAGTVTISPNVVLAFNSEDFDSGAGIGVYNLPVNGDDTETIDFGINQNPAYDFELLLAEDKGGNTISIGPTDQGFIGGGIYWHVVGANDTAIANTFISHLYLPGDFTDYIIGYTGLGLTFTDKVPDRSGVFTLDLGGGTGDLTFADGTTIYYGNRTGQPAIDISGRTSDALTLANGLSVITIMSPAGQVSSTLTEGAGTNTVTLDGSGSTAVYAADGYNTVNVDAGTNVEYLAGSISDYSYLIRNSHSVSLTNIGDRDHTGTTIFNIDPTAVTADRLVFGDGNMVYFDGEGTHSMNFTGTGDSIWLGGTGNTSATLSSGTTIIYLIAPEADFNFSYDGIDKLTVTNINDMDGLGTKTITMAGGNGYINFTNGSPVSLAGASPYYTWPATQYGGTGNDTFYVVNGNYYVDGGTGRDTVFVAVATSGPIDQRWSVTENSLGQIVLSANIANQFHGTITMVSVEQLTVPGSGSYDLYATPVSGGTVNVTGSENSVVVDGAGNDTLDFTATGTNDWHAGAGTTSAVLSAGTTDIYLNGAAADYTEILNGTGQLVITNTNCMDGTGTKTLTLAGGTGELVFSSGAVISLIQAMATFSADKAGFNSQITANTGTASNAFDGSLTTPHQNSWHS